MIDLSPAAQAVLDAFASAPINSRSGSRLAIAAALRAAADQLRKAYTNEEHVDFADDWLDSIANELDPVTS